MSDTTKPTVREEDDADEVSLPDENLAVQRGKWKVRLLSGVGLAATAAGFFTDFSLSDILAVTGGLASLGMVSAGSAALSVLIRRRSLNAKVEVLEELRQEISEHDHAETSSEALTKVYEVIDTRMRELERRITRMGWRQGAAYAIFGAAVAVLLVVFNHWLPAIR